VKCELSTELGFVVKVGFGPDLSVKELPIGPVHTHHTKLKPTCNFFSRAAGLPVARTGNRLFWVGLKSSEFIRAAIFRLKPYVLFGLSGWSFRAGPF
jgi:hypothetical protein